MSHVTYHVYHCNQYLVNSGSLLTSPEDWHKLLASSIGKSAYLDGNYLPRGIGGHLLACLHTNLYLVVGIDCSRHVVE